MSRTDVRQLSRIDDIRYVIESIWLTRSLVKSSYSEYAVLPKEMKLYTDITRW
jgi:hypothetical protein